MKTCKIGQKVSTGVMMTDGHKSLRSNGVIVDERIYTFSDISRKEYGVRVTYYNNGGCVPWTETFWRVPKAIYPPRKDTPSWQ